MIDFGRNKKALVVNYDAVEFLKGIKESSVDLVFCDPIYPGIKRGYGTIGEGEWLKMMDAVAEQARRILRPSGSALFVIQPTSQESGLIRPAVFEFISFWADTWGMVQDLYWWNCCMLPTGNSTQRGLCRPSIKPLAWFGSPDCYRNQKAILWEESDANRAQRNSKRCQHGAEADMAAPPSGHKRDRARTAGAALKNGGVTPFNLWPIPHVRNESGHESETPLVLCEKVIGYLSKPGDIIVDPFCGRGNIGFKALEMDRKYMGSDHVKIHADYARTRIEEL